MMIAERAYGYDTNRNFPIFLYESRGSRKKAFLANYRGFRYR